MISPNLIGFVEILELVRVTLSLAGLLLEGGHQVSLGVFGQRNSLGPRLRHLTANTENPHGLIFMTDGRAFWLESVSPSHIHNKRSLF